MTEEEGIQQDKSITTIPLLPVHIEDEVISLHKQDELMVLADRG